MIASGLFAPAFRGGGHEGNSHVEKCPRFLSCGRTLAVRGDRTSFLYPLLFFYLAAEPWRFVGMKRFSLSPRFSSILRAVRVDKTFIPFLPPSVFAEIRFLPLIPPSVVYFPDPPFCFLLRLNPSGSRESNIFPLSSPLLFYLAAEPWRFAWIGHLFLIPPFLLSCG